MKHRSFLFMSKTSWDSTKHNIFDYVSLIITYSYDTATYSMTYNIVKNSITTAINEVDEKEVRELLSLAWNIEKVNQAELMKKKIITFLEDFYENTLGKHPSDKVIIESIKKIQL